MRYWPRGVRLGLRLRLALACAFLSAAVSIIGLLISLIVVDNSIQETLKFPSGSLVEVTLPGGVQGQQEGVVVINTIRANANDTLLARGLLIALFAGLLGGLAGYVIAARALGPIGELTATARRISVGSLDERIALGGAQDELRNLADTFDAMLDRLDRSFDAQRRFVANASHELRTPLSVIHTEVDVTLADPDATTQELREMGEVVLDATNRANNLVGALLELARIEGQAQQGLVDTHDYDLARAVPLAIQAVHPEAEDRQIVIHAQASPAPVHGDESLLAQMVANLLTNAVRHNIPGGSIWVQTGLRDDLAYLSVANTGEEINSADIDELFMPFRRGAGRTRGTGSGLGLSIVRAIVLAHHGTVELIARSGGGLEVVVTMPSPQPADKPNARSSWTGSFRIARERVD